MKEQVENLLVEAHASAKLYTYDEASINYFDGLITAYEKVLKIMEGETK